MSRNMHERAEDSGYWWLAYVLAFVMLVASCAANAACTSATWAITASPDEPGSVGFTSSLGDDACAAYGTSIAAAGFYTLTSCVQSGTSLTTVATSNADGSTLHYTWANATCDPAAPGGGASSPNVGNVTLVMPDFLNLSASDGLALSVAILSVWATAWGFRQLVRTLRVADGEGED